MKKAQLLFFLFVIVSLAFTLTACHKKPKATIEPTAEAAPPNEGTPSEAQPGDVQKTTEGPVTLDVFDEVNKQLQPVFYDYNRYDVREDQITALQNNARVLKQNTTVNVLIEGHCDERGTDEYNLALGERRADSAKDFLVSLGIAEARLSTISYGESRPFAEGHDEDAWRQNRRAQFVAVRK